MSEHINPGDDLFDEINGHLSFHRKRDEQERAKQPEPEPTVTSGGRPSLILGGDPDELCAFIPTIEAFDVIESDFIGSTELRRIGEGLIQRHGRLTWLSEIHVGYLWAKTGSKKNGNPVLGTLSKPTGPLRFFSGFDLLVTIAADHVLEFGLTNYQVEALVFHELLHAGRTDKGKLTIRGHDLEMFNGEVEVYGLWLGDLKRAAKTFAQAELDFGDAA